MGSLTGDINNNTRMKLSRPGLSNSDNNKDNNNIKKINKNNRLNNNNIYDNNNNKRNNYYYNNNSNNNSNKFMIIFIVISLGLIGSAEGRHRYGNDAGNPLGCSASPSLRVLKYLDRICDDCYMLYRDPDIYQMCRSDCFNNRFFLGCMDVMMVSKVTRHKAAGFVSMINDYTSRR